MYIKAPRGLPPGGFLFGLCVLFYQRVHVGEALALLLRLHRHSPSHYLDNVLIELSEMVRRRSHRTGLFLYFLPLNGLSWCAGALIELGDEPVFLNHVYGEGDLLIDRIAFLRLEHYHVQLVSVVPLLELL